jgi:hypothetical protein
MGSSLGTVSDVAGLLTVSVISEAAISSLGANFGATGLANTDFAVIMSSIPVSKISFFMSHFRLVMSCIWLLVFACFHRIKSGGYSSMEDTHKYPVLAQNLLVAD